MIVLHEGVRNPAFAVAFCLKALEKKTAIVAALRMDHKETRKAGFLHVH